MKIKELQKNVNISWSPVQQYPILLAAGTAAQQLEINGGNSVLEIYSANLLDPGYDLELKISHQCQYRFQKLIWSATGFGKTYSNGLIIGGCEGGHLQVFNAEKLLAGEQCLVASQDKHTGAVSGLDCNPFQNNLLATVASESELFIWDLNNITTPMSPGIKSQPLEDIQNVAWNRQVQHILSTVYSSRCVIWDLRKNEQIMKLSDAQSRVRWRAMQWNPDVATQLWLASEDDQAPFVQLWDLRYATAPTKTLQIHQRGILGLTWCASDSDLMISCGKDNKIYCWNPNSEQPQGEILSEIATTMQWYSDVQWCPRNPALIASSSLEGNVSVYSLFGGAHQQVQTSNKIADSFPGMDEFAQAPIPQQTTQVLYSDLTKPPKWIKRKGGVSFGFGGRLISFNEKTGSNVQINQVITEKELVNRANDLEKTLEDGNYVDYCRSKADQMQDQHGRYLWYFIKANFDANPRDEMLNLLGYNKEDTTKKFQKYIKKDENIESMANKMAGLSHSDSSELEADQSTDDSTDISGDNNALFDAIAAGNKVLEDKESTKLLNYKIPVGEDTEGLVSEAILSGNIEAAVELCVQSEKNAEALIIASTGGIEFLTKIQNSYLEKQNTTLSQIIMSLVSRNWGDVASDCCIDSWKETLVAALSHSDSQIGEICVKIGERLLQETHDLNLSRNALLCFICAGNIEKLVDAWIKCNHSDSTSLNTSELQELVEIVMLLKKALELRGQHVEPTGKLAEFMAQYAGLLAAQGALDTALAYLGPTDNPELEDLRERLYYALGHKQQQRFSRSGPQNLYGGRQQRLSQSRNSFSSSVNPPMPTSNFNNTFAGSTPSSYQPWNSVPQFQQTPAVPLVPTFNAAPPAAQPKPPSINDALSQPQRPSSVGSQGSTSGQLPTRNKYIVDPSVSTGPNYGQNAMFNPVQMGSNNYNSNPSFPAPNQFNTNPLGHYNPQTQPVMPTPQTNFKPFVPTQTMNSSISGGYIPGVPPIDTAQQAMPPPPPINRNPTPPPGWNDPPPISTSRAQQKQKTDSSKLNPITHPIFGATTYDANQNQNGYTDPNSQYMNQNFPPPPMQNNQMYNPTQQVQPSQIFNPMLNNQVPPNDNQNQYPPQVNPLGFNVQAIPNATQLYNEVQQQQQQQQHPYQGIVPPSKKPEPPKEKLPLPEEFIYMQTVFEELKTQCMNTAQDPKTKRKVGDVTKRLDCLYDALREKRLSLDTTNSLNQIVQFIQTGDYGNALSKYTSIISGPDFSQTANFMPGIKILVQVASELKVYLS